MVMRIRELREAADLTQKELAEEMSVQQNAVSNWEAEISLPKTKDLPLLARTLKCSISDLYAESQDTA